MLHLLNSILKKAIVSFIYLVICSSFLFAQDSTHIEFMPADLNFSPIKTNFSEPRIGLQYFTDDGKLKVDLGMSIDIFHYSIGSNEKFSFGVDFMAYALGSKIKSKQLPIETAEGYFGFNFSYKNEEKNYRIRLKAIHNSSHLVDGLYDAAINNWGNGSKPISYSKDYIELTFAHSIAIEEFPVIYFGAVDYALVINPKDQKRLNGSAGFEIPVRITENFFEKDTYLFVAHQLSSRGLEKYLFDNHSMMGIRFGNRESSGVVFYLSYYNGNNFFNQFYKERIERFSFGFFIERI